MWWIFCIVSNLCFLLSRYIFNHIITPEYQHYFTGRTQRNIALYAKFTSTLARVGNTLVSWSIQELTQIWAKALPTILQGKGTNPINTWQRSLTRVTTFKAICNQLWRACSHYNIAFRKKKKKLYTSQLTCWSVNCSKSEATLHVKICSYEVNTDLCSLQPAWVFCCSHWEWLSQYLLFSSFQNKSLGLLVEKGPLVCLAAARFCWMFQFASGFPFHWLSKTRQGEGNQTAEQTCLTSKNFCGRSHTGQTLRKSLLTVL